MLVTLALLADPGSILDPDLPVCESDRRLESLLMTSSSSRSSSSGMYSDDRRLGDRDLPEFGVEMLSDDVRRFVVGRIRKPQYLLSEVVLKMNLVRKNPELTNYFSCLYF